MLSDQSTGRLAGTRSRCQATTGAAALLQRFENTTNTWRPSPPSQRAAAGVVGRRPRPAEVVARPRPERRRSVESPARCSLKRDGAQRNRREAGFGDSRGEQVADRGMTTIGPPRPTVVICRQELRPVLVVRGRGHRRPAVRAGGLSGFRLPGPVQAPPRPGSSIASDNRPAARAYDGPIVGLRRRRDRQARLAAAVGAETRPRTCAARPADRTLVRARVELPDPIQPARAGAVASWRAAQDDRCRIRRRVSRAPLLQRPAPSCAAQLRLHTRALRRMVRAGRAASGRQEVAGLVPRRAEVERSELDPRRAATCTMSSRWIRLLSCVRQRFALGMSQSGLVEPVGGRADWASRGSSGRPSREQRGRDAAGTFHDYPSGFRAPSPE
jgi:hypothetical protein